MHLDQLSIRLGDCQTYKNINLFPIFNGLDGTPVYLSLKEALKGEKLEITEVSEGGSVPTLKAFNKAELPILIIDGEELVGAKQNRIVNTSLLLEANKETLIPVSCTEQGRWNYRSRNFSDAGTMMSSKARYSKSHRVHKSLNRRKAFVAEQAEVWNDVRKLHAKMNTHSHTEAMHEAFEQRKESIEDFLAHFPIAAGQKGAMIFVNGKLAGMDFLSRASAYQNVHEKLLKSHVIEAIAESTQPNTEGRLEMKAAQFIAHTRQLPAEVFESVGLGQDYRYQGSQASAAALVYEDQFIHWTAFPNNMIENPGS